MICSNDPELDAAARNLSWLGINKTTYDRYSKSSYSWEYDVPNLGFKYHGNSISAAMCLVSLRYLEEDNAYRRKLASWYFDRLSQSDHSNSEIEIIEHDDSIISSRHLFQISVNNRDEVLQKLASQDVYCGVHYIANHTYDIYKDFKADTERATYYSQRILSLPLHLGLTEAGSNERGIVYSSCALGPLLLNGIGDTIRVSLFRHASSSNIEVLRNISYQEACSCQIIHLQKIMDFQIFFWLIFDIK